MNVLIRGIMMDTETERVIHEMVEVINGLGLKRDQLDKMPLAVDQFAEATLKRIQGLERKIITLERELAFERLGTIR